MTLKETIRLIKSDYRRYNEPFWKLILLVPGFRYSFNHRLCYYCYNHWYTKILFIILWLHLRRLTFRYGIQTSWNTQLPEGFLILHFGGITFFPDSCGKNIILRQGVTVGTNDKSKRHPTIGNNVTFGSNSLVLGDIIIGDGTIIGANAVVTKSTPPNSVVAGVPARVLRIRE